MTDRQLDKILDKVRQFKKELAIEYNVAESAIVWIGRNNFIVIKDGKEFRI